VLQRPLDAKPSQWLTFRPSPTIGRSLGRLAKGGHIIKVQAAHGNYPARWKIAEGYRLPVLARTTPGSDLGDGAGTADAFRRRDLQSPGALYAELPESQYLTAVEVLARTKLTGRVRTVETWLLVLASQKWPLVDELVAEASPSTWAKNRLEDWQFEENADHVDGIAALTGQLRLKTRKGMQLHHQIERAGRMFRGGAVA
jgi:hypothetical protein